MGMKQNSLILDLLRIKNVSIYLFFSTSDVTIEHHEGDIAELVHTITVTSELELFLPVVIEILPKFLNLKNLVDIQFLFVVAIIFFRVLATTDKADKLFLVDVAKINFLPRLV